EDTDSEGEQSTIGEPEMLGITQRVWHAIKRRFTPPPSIEVKQGPLLYDEEAFRRRECYRANYMTLCDALADVLDFGTVLDLGCANGFLLESMDAKGKSVWGVELSPAALNVLPPALRNRVQIGDATAIGRINAF